MFNLFNSDSIEEREKFVCLEQWEFVPGYYWELKDKPMKLNLWQSIAQKTRTRPTLKTSKCWPSPQKTQNACMFVFSEPYMAETFCFFVMKLISKGQIVTIFLQKL